MRLIWMNKSKKLRKPITSSTVTVSDVSRGTNIILRNNCYAGISKTGYIKLAVKNNRMYFAEATAITGWKMSQKQNSSTRYVQIGKKFKQFIGDYDLLWDDNCGYYYIEIQK